jgi:hypothetical protein
MVLEVLLKELQPTVAPDTDRTALSLRMHMIARPHTAELNRSPSCSGAKRHVGANAETARTARVDALSCATARKQPRN